MTFPVIFLTQWEALSVNSWIIYPMQAHMVDRIMGYPWLNQEKYSTHSSKPLPNQPDPSIRKLKFDMDYRPNSTFDNQNI